MQTITSFLDQALMVWKDSTAAARFGIALLLVICIGAIVGVGIWSSRPNYITLASGLDHVKSAQLIAALDSADIRYQIKGAGSIIQVDQRKFEEANIAAGKIGIGSQEPVLETSSPWMDPLNQQNVLRRNLERQLASSIQRFASISSATVHLSIPERQPFLRKSGQPKASVILELASHQPFGERQAMAVAALVANAVPGLRTDQVAISDTSGRIYSSDESVGRLTQQEEFRYHRERELASKAQAMLTNFLGVGNSRVEVTADFSFPEAKTVSTEYDPDGKVLTSETVDSSTTIGEKGLGGAGTQSNLGTSSTRSQKMVTSKSEVLESKYEVSSTTREDISRTPVLKLLTVSVLINSAKLQDKNKEIPPELRKSIEALVKKAVGFREETDQFTIEFFEFVPPIDIDETPVAAFPWDQLNNILKNISLGLAALVALFLGLKALKGIKPAPGAAQPTAQLPSDRASQINELSELVKQNPEIFSKIIAGWAAEGGTPEPERQQEQAA